MANYLRVFRSVPLEVEQVIITSGTQQSLELCALLFADHGDTVWRESWRLASTCIPWRLTSRALRPGIKTKPRPAPDLCDAVPPISHGRGDVTGPPAPDFVDRPTAQGLGDGRRLRQRISLQRPPISSLAGLDTDERVLYMGSFSKVLQPGLKLAYLVVPKGLVASFKQAHHDLNRPGQMPLQAALSEFIEMGHFASALRRARQSYGQRRVCLLEALNAQAYISGVEQGLHLCLRLPDAVDDKALADRLALLGLTLRPLSAYCLKRTDAKGLVIGYGYAPLAEIERCGPLLARAVTEALAKA